MGRRGGGAGRAAPSLGRGLRSVDVFGLFCWRRVRWLQLNIDRQDRFSRKVKSMAWRVGRVRQELLVLRMCWHDAPNLRDSVLAHFKGEQGKDEGMRVKTTRGEIRGMEKTRRCGDHGESSTGQM